MAATGRAAVAITDTPDADDVEPHPLVGDSPDRVELYWGRDEPVGSFTYDIVREPSVVVNDTDLRRRLRRLSARRAVARAAALLSSLPRFPAGFR